MASEQPDFIPTFGYMAVFLMSVANDVLHLLLMRSRGKVDAAPGTEWFRAEAREGPIYGWVGVARPPVWDRPNYLGTAWDCPKSYTLRRHVQAIRAVPESPARWAR